MSGVVVVVTGGDPPAPEVAVGLPEDAYVIAADSGLDVALALDLDVDLVIGDLDSVSPDALVTARARGTEIEAHPAAKDQTDLELALDRALDGEPDRIVVLGGDGGRFDHLLAGVLALASERYAEVAVEARLGPALVTVLRAGGSVVLHGTPGDMLTLLPVGGPVTGITTDGLAYPLHDEDLMPGTTRGVSNEFVSPTAEVTLRAGVLLAIQPHR